MKKITILGTGSFGTAMAICLESSSLNITLWGHNEKTCEEIKTYRTNKRYLGEEIYISKNIQIESDLKIALKDADIVLFVVPSQAVREVARKVAPFLKPNAYLFNFAKGLELSTYMRLSEVIQQEIPHHRIGVVSGPSHAEEVAKKHPTSLVVATKDLEDATKIQELFSNESLRIYSSIDIIGVEMAGVIKNIIALSAGISDGLGYGNNTKSLLITRGLVEMTRIGKAVGANPETFLGLAGLGDLVVTATSVLSRNWTFGNKLGSGKTKEEALSEMSMVVEGLTAAKSTYELAKKLNIEMPITQQVYSILYEGIDPKESVKLLMSRSHKQDGYY